MVSAGSTPLVVDLTLLYRKTPSCRDISTTVQNAVSHQNGDIAMKMKFVSIALTVCCALGASVFPDAPRAINRHPRRCRPTAHHQAR